MTRSRALCVPLLLVLLAACSSSKSGTGPTPGSSTGSSDVSPGGSPLPGGSDSPIPSIAPQALGKPSTSRAGVRIPGVGTYSYDTAIAAQGNSFTGERTQSYFPGQPAGDATDVTMRQTTRITPETAPKVFWFRFRWQRDGMYELAEINPSGGPCTFDHPMLVLQMPVRIGASWSSNAKCKEDGTVHALNARVQRSEVVTVGKTHVRTLVVERQSTTGSSQPLIETWWFSPEWLVNMKMDTTTHAAGASFDLKDNLRSLKPGPLPGDSHPRGY